MGCEVISVDVFSLFYAWKLHGSVSLQNMQLISFAFSSVYREGESANFRYNLRQSREK
jgi:hypothetical protein